MIATTDQKARLLDLTTGVLELVRDGNRDIDQVSAVLQVIKDDPDFAVRLLVKDGSWPVWRMLAVGGADAAALENQLKDGGFGVSYWARDIMSKPAFKTSVEPREASFVRVEVRDLGFTTAPTTRELFDRKRLARFNLDLCKAEDGPHLRLVDKDQPVGDWYCVAMEPITASDGGPHVFYVERYVGGKRWLCANCAHHENRWDLGHVFVFRLRK